MKPLEAELHERLERLRAGDLLRSLQLPDGIDFASNDYLGIASHPRLKEMFLERLEAVGPELAAPASRLLRGNTELHVRLEERLAAFKGTEATLLFSSGYLANLAVLTTLVSPRDRVLSDAQNHASIIDGIRMCRCEKRVFPHLDIAELERALGAPYARGRTFVYTESLYSMDGDIAPLDVYAELAEKHGASLIVDDAHATGLWGDARGSGLTEHFDVARRTVATVSTFGKALGLAGAFVAGPRVVIDTLVNRARPFIFTTAPAPLFLAAIEAALDILAAEPERRGSLHERAEQLRSALRERGVDCLQSEGPIVPVVVGDNDASMKVAARVRTSGFDVRAIRPPSVAPGTARLRISVHADHTPATIDALAAAVVGALGEEGAAGTGKRVPS